MSFGDIFWLARAITLLALTGVMTLCPLAAYAEYRVRPGDILSFSLVGTPDLTRQIPIDADGEVSVPLVGQVLVAGLSINDARARVQSSISGKEYRRRNEDGREFSIRISPSEVGLSVAEYRPVYLNGDIAKPGAIAYRPGLTVRHAVAIAGGYDILRFKMENPFLHLSDLRSEYNGLWITFARQQTHVARLQAEVDGKQDVDISLLVSTPIAIDFEKFIVDNERRILSIRTSDYQKEIDYLKNSIATEEERGRVLVEQRGKEQEGVEADTVELSRYDDLVRRGVSTATRLSDARRTVLLSSTRALQTTALLIAVQRENSNLMHRLDRLAGDREIQVLKDLQDARVQLATTRARLQSVSEKLRYTGMVKSQLVRGGESRPTIRIVRSADGRQVEIPGALGTELEPDDLVDVALQVDDARGP